jgi:hypothetical protein
MRDFVQSVSNACLFKPFDLRGLHRSIEALLEQEAAAALSTQP